MERVITFRKPISSKAEGLSKTARIFFGLNIFQVFVIGGIQGAMIIFGDFSPVSEKGLGPGRRIYMALFLGAILYSCFLCLFAVKMQNYLEILAFVFQNYGYIAYSGIQVYHIGLKKYENHPLRRQRILVYLTFINSSGLFVLNIVFTYLAVKLYGEYGWKIYKRVRFNIQLRAAFHLYETVIMLLKMVFLFVTMYAICFTQTMFRGKYGSFGYIASMVSIPVSLIWAIFGIISIRRENRIMAYFYIFGVAAAFVYFVFKIVRVATKTCSGCVSFQKTTDDIPGEVDLHLLYLAAMNVTFMLLLLLASIKATRNFGNGLKGHFKSEPSSKLTVLNLSKNVFTSIVPSTAEENRMSPDLESPRPSVSIEPRPSIFQLMPKFGSSHFSDDSNHQAKGVTLPAQFRKGEKISKQIRSSAKSRISQLFWENEIGNMNRSQQSSFSSRTSSSCFKSCCPWTKPRRLNFSTYGMPQANEAERRTSNTTESIKFDQVEVKYENNNGKQRKRSRSLGGNEKQDYAALKKPCIQRFNSVPYKDLPQTARIFENIAATESVSNTPSQSSSSTALVDKIQLEATNNLLSDASCIKQAKFGDPLKSCLKNPEKNVEISLEARESACRNNRIDSSADTAPSTHVPLRRIKSSLSSISSIKTESTDFDDSDEDIEGNSVVNSGSRQRKLGVVYESPDIVKKSVSDYNICSYSKQFKNVHFV